MIKVHFIKQVFIKNYFGNSKVVKYSSPLNSAECFLDKKYLFFC